MAANKAEFENKLVDLTQEIRASTESELIVVLSNLGRVEGRDFINNRLNTTCSRDRGESVVGR
jgi:hypothetical protein